MMRKPVEFTDFPRSLSALHEFGPYRAIVRNIVDGDTIDCLIDLGFNDYTYRVVRLAEIDAPEKNRAATVEAGKASERYLESLIPVGTPVLLFTLSDPDSFGRYIAHITATDDSGTYVVNDRMVESGHAVVRHYK